MEAPHPEKLGWEMNGTPLGKNSLRAMDIGGLRKWFRSPFGNWGDTKKGSPWWTWNSFRKETKGKTFRPLGKYPANGGNDAAYTYVEPP